MNLLFFTNKYIKIFLSFIAWIIFSIKDIFYDHEELPPIEDDLLLLPATTLAKQIRKQKVSSEQIVRVFINRINAVNKSINALVQDRFHEAISEAKAADKFIRNNPKEIHKLETAKPFYGVPFTQKDSLAVAGLPHTAGFYPRRNLIAKEDSDLTKKVKDSGAILLGVSNVQELCLWWECQNVIYGKTNNPYKFNRIPGGSSGGEGAILSAAGSVIGFGSDIGGSLRGPAFFCGIFAHKPSPGFASVEGHFPLPEPIGPTNYGVVGPMCRYATDLKPSLKILLDPSHLSELKLDDPIDMSKITVYYLSDNEEYDAMLKINREISTAIKMAISYLKNTYSMKSKQVKFPEFNQSVDMFWSARWDRGSHVSTYIKQYKNDFNIWTEILKYVCGISCFTAHCLFRCLLENYGQSFCSSPRYSISLYKLESLRLKFKELMKPNTVLLLPTNPLQAPHHYETLFKPFNNVYAGIFNLLHAPVTACPLGLGSIGLPLGLQIVGGFGEDRVCIAVAEELEKAFGGWVPPCNVKC